MQKKDICIDHDHKTNLVRGLLCKLCNSGLGFFRDKPDFLKRAIFYLKGEIQGDRIAVNGVPVLTPKGGNLYFSFEQLLNITRLTPGVLDAMIAHETNGFPTAERAWNRDEVRRWLGAHSDIWRDGNDEGILPTDENRKASTDDDTQRSFVGRPESRDESNNGVG